MVLIFFVVSLIYSNNTILYSQINQNEVISSNFNDINMKKKSKNTTIKPKSTSKVKTKRTLTVSNSVVTDPAVASEPLINDNLANNLAINLDRNLEKDNKTELNEVQKIEQKAEQTSSQTKYFSLIFKDEKTPSLDSNQNQFIEKLFLVLKQYPNKHLALLSYVNGNKNPEDNLKVAKLRNKYIIDYMTKNGIAEDRISKKGVSGLIVKENIELFKNSNIIEIIITEQNKLKKNNFKQE